MIGIERLNIGGREINPNEALTMGGSYTFEVVPPDGSFDRRFHLFNLSYMRRGKSIKLRTVGAFILPDEHGKQQLSPYGNGLLVVSGPTHPFLCNLWSQGQLMNVDRFSPPAQGKALWDLAPDAGIPCDLPDEIVMGRTLTLRSGVGLLKDLRLSSAGVSQFNNLGFFPYGEQKGSIKGLITQGKPPYLRFAWLDLHRKTATLYVV